MYNKILVHLQYPYTVGIILIIWVGSLALYMIDETLPIILMVIINSLLTLLFTYHSMR
jgi:hypothetical protein